MGNGDPPRDAMLLGHPGHELRVLGWVARSRPKVAVLTDGSGSGVVSRLPMTLDALAALGSERLELHDGMADAGLYSAILRGDTGLFASIAGRFADALVVHSIDRVVSDGVEGYNPTHDLCAAIAARAARLGSERRGRRIQHFTFPLIGPAVPDPLPEGALMLTLDESEVGAKISSARRYAAAAGGVLVEEVEQLISRLGRDGMATEMLAPADLGRDFAPFLADPPFYEAYGRKRVEQGVYPEAIQYRRHIVPILDALGS